MYNTLEHCFTGLDDWDIIGPVDFPQQRAQGYLDGGSLLGTLTSQVGKTVSRSMQKVMGRYMLLVLYFYIDLFCVDSTFAFHYYPFMVKFWKKMYSSLIGFILCFCNL